MGKLIFNAQAEPVAPVGASKHTMYVDSVDGKLKMKDSDGCINNVLCDKDISYQNVYNSISISLDTDCSDGDMHITTDCGSCWDPNHNFFLCAKEYNFNTFCIDPNVIVRFCGEGMPIIKAKCFVNCGTINTRTGPLESLECNFLFGGTIVNIKNIGSIGIIDCIGGLGAGGGGNGGGYDPEGTGSGGRSSGTCSSDMNGKGGPYAGGGGGSYYDGAAGCQETGIGGTGGHGVYGVHIGGGGGGRGIVCGGDGGCGGCNSVGGNGGNGYYGKGGGGGRGYNTNGGCGGDSYFGDGGEGCMSNKGGNSYYGCGGNMINQVCNRYCCGGCSYASDGGNSAGGNGGHSLGGAYGLIISSPVFINNCIWAKGGNGGTGTCGCNGCGTNGGYIYINTKSTPQNRDSLCNINVLKGTGANCTYDGFLCVTDIFN